MSITIEQQREKIRLSLEGKSVSIPSARTKKSYVKNGKKKFKARAYFKGIKNTYG